jgi:hypothetical protein
MRLNDKVAVITGVHRGLFRTVDDLATYEKLKLEFAANPPALEGF